MNVYVKLNEIIEYTENHLEEKIDYKKAASIMGVNEYTFQKLFLIISNISFCDYIRSRRLSNAGQELFLNKEKIIDIAMKYQYNSAIAFSRAFTKFHGMKPSEVRKNPEKLKMYTRLHFKEQCEYNQKIDYKIIEMEEMTLYGNYVLANNDTISKIAPEFYSEKANKYIEPPPYGMVEYYDKERSRVKAYWILYNEKKEGMEKKIIPKSRWIQIKVNSQNSEEIQNVSTVFYQEFLPNAKYNFRDLPEIEHYHDEITDFLIPIED